MKKLLTLAISIGKEHYIEAAPKIALHTSAKSELYSLCIIRATASKELWSKMKNM